VLPPLGWNSSSLCFVDPSPSSPATTGLNFVIFLLISLLDTLAKGLSSRRLAGLCSASLLQIYSTLMIDGVYSNPLDLLATLPRPWLAVDIACSFERVANRPFC
jgi:hypothetical protein